MPDRMPRHSAADYPTANIIKLFAAADNRPETDRHVPPFTSSSGDMIRSCPARCNKNRGCDGAGIGEFLHIWTPRHPQTDVFMVGGVLGSAERTSLCAFTFQGSQLPDHHGVSDGRIRTILEIGSPISGGEVRYIRNVLVLVLNNYLPAG